MKRDDGLLSSQNQCSGLINICINKSIPSKLLEVRFVLILVGDVCT
jgi:hypothetical protein